MDIFIGKSTLFEAYPKVYLSVHGQSINGKLVTTFETINEPGRNCP